MATVSRMDKYIPADGKVPPEAKYICKTCNMWVASQTGQTGHRKRFPGHVLVNVKTGYEVGNPLNKIRKDLLHNLPTNGHFTEISPALLEYAFSKMRQTIESELDRLHDQLIPSPAPATRRSKFYVAR
jgi:hypothetical protein